MAIERDVTAARERHRRAVAEFVRRAWSVTDEAWELQADPDAWTPAQIAEHLRLAYEVVGEGVVSGGGLRVRSAWWMRPLLRWKFLGGILERGRFPRSKAPREIRPGAGPFPRELVLGALEAAAARTEARIAERWHDPDCRVTHHVFGAMAPPEGMRLLTVHTEHHAGQLAQRPAAVATP